MTAKQRLLERRTYLEKRKGNIIIDADTHISDMHQPGNGHLERLARSNNYYHGKPIGHSELLAEMRMAGVDMALCWQNPAATQYTSDKNKNYAALLKANEYIAHAAEQFREKIIPAGWTDPKALTIEDAKKLATECVQQFGFSIVKMNPAQNAFPIDSDPVIDMVEHIVGLGATPSFHFGGDTPYTPAEGLKAVASHIAPHPLIAIHMGGGGAAFVEAEQLYLDARELGLEHPNIHYVLSAKRDTHMESDIITYAAAGEPFINNLCCASDAPYGRMTWNFGGFRAMLHSLQNREDHPDPRISSGEVNINGEIQSKLLGGNFAMIVIDSIDRVLAESF